MCATPTFIGSWRIAAPVVLCGLVSVLHSCTGHLLCFHQKGNLIPRGLSMTICVARSKSKMHRLQFKEFNLRVHFANEPRKVSCHQQSTAQKAPQFLILFVLSLLVSYPLSVGTSLDHYFCTRGKLGSTARCQWSKQGRCHSLPLVFVGLY